MRHRRVAAGRGGGRATWRSRLSSCVSSCPFVSFVGKLIPSPWVARAVNLAAAMLRKIDRVVFRVPSLPAAVGYYRDVLGLKLLRQDSRVASFQLASDSAELILHTDPDLPGEAVYYLVDDVRDLYRRRAQLKLTFTSAPAPAARGYRAAVRDPFGTVLLLLDRSTEAAGAGTVEDA